MEIVTVVNRKGGVGKTVTAHNLAAYIHNICGKSVLAIDLDSQANLTYSYGLEESDNIIKWLQGEIEAEKVIKRTENNGYIIPSSPRLALAETMFNNTGREYKLREALEGVEYDYIIIDTPATLGILTVNALTVSDKVIIPMQADIYSLQGFEQLKDMIGSVKKYTNPNLKIEGLLLTRYNGRTNLAKSIREALEEEAKALGTKVFKTPIRECIAIKESTFKRMSVLDYAPGSNAAHDYIDFGEEFIE